MIIFRRMERGELLKRFERANLHLECSLDQLESQGPESRYWIYGGTREAVENVEWYRVNQEAADDVQKPDSAAWLTEKHDFYRSQLDAIEGSASRRDIAQVQGVRKLICKWNENLVYLEAVRNFTLLKQRGQDDSAQDVVEDWNQWFRRPDRKAFDGPPRFDDGVREFARENGWTLPTR